METYTENEIKEWFNRMKKKYPNSITFQHLEAVEFMMFNKVFGTTNCLEKIKKSS